MALQYSPKIVQDGLVMCLDASQNKSYPTTDLPVKSGLLLWLDASDDSTFSYSSGTEVSQWRDKSGNNFHANQSTTANQPSRSSVLNSRKSVNFVSSSGDFMRVSSGIVTPNYITVFTVIKPGTQGNDYAVILEQDHGNGYNGWVIQRNVNTSNWQTWISYQSNWLNANSVSYTAGTAQIVTLRKNASTVNLYSNATSNGAVSISDAVITQTSYGLNLGYWQYGGGRYYHGEMCEILVFNRGLSDVELRQINTYLGQKWSISNTDRSIIDLSGFNDNGLLGDGTTANMPVYDYYNKGAFRFDGSNDFIKVGANSSLQVNNVTIAAFFKTVNNGQSVQFIAGYGDTGIAGYWIGTSGGPIRFSIGGGTGNYLQQSSGVTPNNDQIYYVVGTYDGTNQRVYVDGVLQASATTVTGNISYTGLTDGFLVGQVQGFTAGRYLTGNVYNVSVYSRALSQAEISQNYEALKSKFTNTIVQQGLVLNLDAGNPYSYAAAGSDWFDVSGNNNTSLLVGTTLPTFSNTNGGILIYDGDTQYSRTPSPSNNFAWTPSGVGLNNMTIDLWIKTTDGSGTILSKPWSGNGEYNFGLGHQGFSIVIGNQTNTLGFSSILTGNWINLVIVVSPTQYGAYINGVQNTALTNHGITNNTPTYGNGQIELTLMTLYPYGGGGNAGFSTQGNIGSFRIYNRVLSASEVLQNYNATKGRFGL
jgi:hypothetical protein